MAGAHWARPSGKIWVATPFIDPDFRSMRWAEREDRLWPLLHQLSYETLSDITILLLLTPEEAPKSMANMEFENPVTWPLEEDTLLVAADD